MTFSDFWTLQLRPFGVVSWLLGGVPSEGTHGFFAAEELDPSMRHQLSVILSED